MNLVPCLICGVALYHAIHDNTQASAPHPDSNHPLDAVACRAGGHYGSVVLDEMGHGHIQFAVCDKCLVQRLDRVVYLSHLPDDQYEAVSDWLPAQIIAEVLNPKDSV